MARTACSRARGPRDALSLAAGCGGARWIDRRGGEHGQERHARDRERGQGRHARPGGELGQREHLADPEHLQPARSSRTRPAPRLHPGPGHVVGHLEGRPDLHVPPADDDKFSDGTPVTAEDVRYSIERSKNFKGGWGFLLDAVKTRHRARRAHGRDQAVAAARAAARRPGHVRLLDRAGEAGEGAGRQGFFQHPVGSGPFMVTQLQQGQRGRPGRRTRTGTARSRRSRTSRSMIVPNDNSRVLLLQSKKADVIENPPGQPDQPDQQEPRTCRRELFPSTRVDFIQLDEHFAPFKDQNVRAGAELRDRPQRDRQARVLRATRRRAPRSCRTRCSSGTPSLKPYPYDLAKAKAAAGASRGTRTGFNTLPDRGRE